MRKRAFKDLAEYRAERELLKTRVHMHATALAQRRDWLKEPQFRNELLGNTALGVVRGFRPLEMLGSLVSTGSSPLAPLVAGLLGSRARTLKGKLLTWGLAMALPPVLKVVGRSEFFKNAMDKVLAFTKGNSEDEEEPLDERHAAMETSAED